MRQLIVSMVAALFLLTTHFAIANDDRPTTRLFRPGGIAAPEQVAGGYRALFTCSAHFHAGRSLAQIKAIELVDTHALELPAPVIDTTRRLVTAADDTGQTWTAVYRPAMGCVLLPPDWTHADMARLPHVEISPAPDLDDVDFPRGDAINPQAPARLQPVIQQAFDGASFGAGTVTAGVMVLRGDEVLAERYGNGFGPFTGYRTWSTAKSITATIIGIAVKEGLLALDAPVPVPEFQFLGDPRAAITLNNLMHMSSGLESGGSNTNALYFAGQDAISSMTSMPLEEPPGTRWKYANNDTLLLLRSLRHVLGNDYDYLRYPYDKLLKPIGMHHTRMETDHAGNFIGSSQVYTTTRDLARLGLLYLNDGKWMGKQLLPEDWTDYVSTPAPTRPTKPNEQGYGAQFWLLGTYDGIPPDAYTSAGNKGQFVTIIPSRNLVIVRTGVDPNGKRWQIDKWVRAVLDAVE